MFDTPRNHDLNLIAALSACVLFVIVVSSPATWLSWFPKHEGAYEIYKKRGEYGEYEKRQIMGKLPFMEPLNAITSLAYSFFGIVVLITGYNDMMSDGYDNGNANRMIESGGFSIMYGMSMTYLGLASFLFHASHAEKWRKADAGMTSGVIIAPVVFSLWDRVRPPGVETYWYMVLAGVVLQLSLTHGFLPYGSSDVLLPSLVAVTWGLELLPRYGGVVSDEQYTFWHECCYAVLIGMFLRLADVKRKNLKFKNTVMLLGAVMTLGMIYLLGVVPATVAGSLALTVVFVDSTLGHIFWHFFSAYALYLWWFQFRVRPGDPSSPRTEDVSVITLFFFIALKNAVRRSFMTMPFTSTETRDRVMFLLEHTVFAAAAYYCLVIEPDEGLSENAGTNSWLLTPRLCWQTPVYEFNWFHLFYLAKTGTHVEDVLYMYFGGKDDATAAAGAADGNNKGGSNGGVDEELPLIDNAAVAASSSSSSSAKAPKKKKDKVMMLHHGVTAALCLASAYYGYAKIGSLVMFLHDVSDIPLDLVRLFGQLNMKSLQLLSFGATLLSWAYWRLFWFPTEVLYSIAYDAKSLIKDDPCEIGACPWSAVPERVPFLLLLGTLLCLHVVWFWLMLKKAKGAFKSGSKSSE
jgi:hypothetical protein